MTPLLTSAVCQACWRSSGVEQRFCKPRVGGSNPFASSMGEPAEGADPLSRRGVCGSRSSRAGNVERFPSGQREQTVNLPAYAFEGSNPSLSTTRREAGNERGSRAGIAQLVEHQPSKLRVAGSSPVSRSTRTRLTTMDRRRERAHVAQSVEHFLGKEEVTGSNPVMGSSAWLTRKE